MEYGIDSKHRPVYELRVRIGRKEMDCRDKLFGLIKDKCYKTSLLNVLR